jgi:hypothetical protein
MLIPDHPDTLQSQNNLAAAYQEAGRAAEAIALLEQTLADRERSWARTTPTPWPPGTTSPPPGRHWADACPHRGREEHGALCAGT